MFDQNPETYHMKDTTLCMDDATINLHFIEKTNFLTL